MLIPYILRIITPNQLIKHPSHLYQVGTRLHRACPEVSALSHSQVCHQQVRRQVAGSECAVSSLQEGEAWHTAGVGLAFTQCQSVGMQTPAWVQGETQHWEDGGGGGKRHTRRERRCKEGERWRGRKGVRREEGLDPEAGTNRLQQVWTHNGQRAKEEWEEKMQQEADREKMFIQEERLETEQR